MIQFLSPLWLFAAAAAAVPLVLHLLRRRTGAPVEFPAVRWLARAEREHSRSLRLRNVLLMLLRVAVVLLLALAAARPVARVAGVGHAPTALAIVLDNSLSTTAVVDGRPVLDDLKRAALAAAARANDDDRLWMVTADGAVHGGSAAAVRAAIAEVAPLAGAGDLARSAERAGALVAASPLSTREIAILTDGQATAWRSVPALGDARVTLFRPAAPAPADHAVVSVRAEPAYWTPRGAVEARVRTSDSTTYRIRLAARTLARGTVARDGEILVRAAPPERGWHAGAVELEPDELRGDDVRHFALWIGPPPAVRVDPSAGIFAEAAVAVLVRAGRLADGGDVDVTAADQARRLPALLLAPANPVRAGAANRALERLGVPWRFGAERRGETAIRGIAGATATHRFALQAAGGAPAADTVARAGDEPWIVRGPGYVLVASALLPDATDLPARAAFVPWLTGVLTQDLAGHGAVLAAAPGERVARPPGVDALERDGGARMPVSGDSLTAPAAAGVSWLVRGGVRAGALVVNAEPRESELARLDLTALSARVRARDAKALDAAAPFAAALFAGSPRRAIGVWLVALALALLLVESLAAGGRKEPA